LAVAAAADFVTDPMLFVADAAALVMDPNPDVALLKAAPRDFSTQPAMLIAISISLLFAIYLRCLLCDIYQLIHRHTLKIVKARVQGDA